MLFYGVVLIMWLYLGMMFVTGFDFKVTISRIVEALKAFVFF